MTSINFRYKQEAAIAPLYDQNVNYHSLVDGGKLLAVLQKCQVKVNQFSRVLDVGCGNGEAAILLAKQFNCHVTGIDCSEKRIERAKQLAEAQGVNSRLLQTDIYDFLENDKSPYDLVMCFEVLEHLANPQRVIQQCCAALAPGGIFVGSVPLNHPAKTHLQLFKDRSDVEHRLALPVVHVELQRRRSGRGFAFVKYTK